MKINNIKNEIDIVKKELYHFFRQSIINLTIIKRDHKMMTQMRGKKIFLAVILSLVLSFSTPIQCLKLAKVKRFLPKKQHIMLTAAALTVATMAVFFSREPGTYKLKFDSEKLEEAWENKEVKTLLKQYVYYLSDLLGCAGKGSSLKVVKNGDKSSLVVGPSAQYVGLGGLIHMHLKPLMAALGFFVALNKFQDTISDSMFAIKEFAGYDVVLPLGNDVELPL